jgi:hypothetical protein
MPTWAWWTIGCAVYLALVFFFWCLVAVNPREDT